MLELGVSRKTTEIHLLLTYDRCKTDRAAGSGLGGMATVQGYLPPPAPHPAQPRREGLACRLETSHRETSIPVGAPVRTGLPLRLVPVTARPRDGGTNPRRASVLRLHLLTGAASPEKKPRCPHPIPQVREVEAASSLPLPTPETHRFRDHQTGDLVSKVTRGLGEETGLEPGSVRSRSPEGAENNLLCLVLPNTTRLQGRGPFRLVS